MAFIAMPNKPGLRLIIIAAWEALPFLVGSYCRYRRTDVV